ncbi:MAG: hypothetical protein OXN97_24765 [Bryobacterales bacterium]|nr:hypothetical protein [Bryobacterales bacterium]
MNVDKLTHDDAGNDVTPRTSEDWDEWVSATKLRGHLLKETLGDWLDRYGDDRCFVRDECRDDYDENLDFLAFRREQGRMFEAAVAAYLAERTDLVRIASSGRDSRDLHQARETLAALTKGREVIHQGILWNPEDRTYGVPDFLVRSDAFDRLFPDHLDPGEAERPAPGLHEPWHYLVVDAKFTKLHLGKELKKLLAEGSSTAAYKAQLCLCNAALGRLQGYTPPGAYLLGRGYEHKSTRSEFPPRSNVATDRLGLVTMDDGLRKKVADATGWMRRLRREGGDWSPLPEPSVPELEPKKSDGPWSETIKEIARQRRELTDPPASGSVVRPARIEAAEEFWRKPAPLEFFVDFEFVHDLDDDFRTFPKAGGQEVIFMIGCGHVENAAWHFRCFVADRLDLASEARIVSAWLAHMEERSRHFRVDAPKVFHWTHAEPTNYVRARKRHPCEPWPEPAWFDLHKRVFKAEPVSVRSSDSLGLKSIAKALHAHGLIQTSWGDSSMDGMGAMVGAWRCDREGRRTGGRLVDAALIKEIRDYNDTDCKVMQEILDYLREHH